MSKRKLYPPRTIDRGLFWTAIAGIVVYGLNLEFAWRTESPLWPLWLLIVLLFVVGLVLVYFKQDQDEEDPETQYSTVIEGIEQMGRRLGTLADFLKAERARVEESQAIINRLRNERSELEPVVTAHKATVAAILSAQAKTAASKAWKERLLGFLSGVIASLLATLLFEMFRG